MILSSIPMGACLIFATLLAASPAFAVESRAPVRTIGLATALEQAAKSNLDFSSKSSLVDQAEARSRQARAAAYPKITGTGILSPLYSAVGDPVHSENDLSKYGYWLQATLTILQPVYTFGRLSSFREAAGFGAEVARAQNRKDLGALAYEVKEVYYGAILADQLFSFLDEGRNEVRDILKKAEFDQKKKRPAISKRDYYRLRIFAAEADYRWDEADRLRRMARYALSLKIGFDPSEPTYPEETMLSPIEAEPPAEQDLISRFVQERPELAQLKSGIAAKRALLGAESANRYPMFFVGGMLSMARSDVRTPQQSAFAYDPYNRSSGGVGIGAQWSWDYATTLANEAMLKSEIDELEKKQAYATQGLKLELRNTLAELVEARSRLATSREAFQVGKKWLVSETMGYSIGVGDVKNLIDAYLARAKTTKDHWEAIYRLNMSWANLSRAVGSEITPGLASPPR